MDGVTDSMDMSLSKLGDNEGQGGLRAAVHGVANSQTRLSSCTTTPQGDSSVALSTFVVLYTHRHSLCTDSSSPR